MKIKAVIASEKHDSFTYSEAELEAPRADEILVEIKAVGLCHTDLLARSGVFQMGIDAVLGHEGAGIVQQVGGEVTKVKAGDRVGISFRYCGECRKCASQDSAYCKDFVPLNIFGRRLDGSRAISRNGEEIGSHFFGQSSFASHALTSQNNVVKLPDHIPFEVAAPLGCGVQTGAGAVLNSLECGAGSSIIVAGCGVVGLSAVMAAKISGCENIIAIEPVKARRKLAFEVGATHAIDPLEHEDFEQAIRQIVPDGVDYAVDTTGRRLTLANLTRCFATQGTLGMVGMVNPEDDFVCTGMQFMSGGLTVKGIIEGDSHPEIFIPQLIEYYKKGQLPIDKLIATYPLKDINKAVEDHHSGLCTKAVLIP